MKSTVININEEWFLTEREYGWVILNSIDPLKQIPMDIFEKVKFMQIKPYVSIALACAEEVYPIFHAKYPKDTEIIDCIKTTKLYLVDKVSKEELNKTARAAYAATAAYAAHDAASAAAYAAHDAASAAAYAAANAAHAAYAAANAAHAAYAAAYAAHDAASAAAYAAANAAHAAYAAAYAAKIKWFQEWLDD